MPCAVCPRRVLFVCAITCRAARCRAQFARGRTSLKSGVTSALYSRKCRRSANKFCMMPSARTEAICDLVRAMQGLVRSGKRSGNDSDEADCAGYRGVARR